MLTLDHLLIRQGDFSLQATFSLTDGARVGVLGPSGEGKSTLLAAIAGFVSPAQGRILWDGRDLTNVPPAARPVSILFQDNNLFPHLSSAQNVGLGLRPDLRLTASERVRVTAALGRVGLAGMGARKPGSLSGGQQGRVALARMLLRARPLVLLDEPFAALGPALKREMMALVAELADETGAAVMMVSHDPADARLFARQCILVADGIAAPPLDTEALFRAPPATLRAYLGT